MVLHVQRRCYIYRQVLLPKLYSYYLLYLITLCPSNSFITKFVDQLNGTVLGGPSADSTLLAIPQQPNDPKLTAKALDAARGYYAGRNVPAEFVEAIASVAAYVSSTQGIPIGNLINKNTVSLKLIQAYNEFNFQEQGSIQDKFLQYYLES